MRGILLSGILLCILLVSIILLSILLVGIILRCVIISSVIMLNVMASGKAAFKFKVFASQRADSVTVDLIQVIRFGRMKSKDIFFNFKRIPH